MKGTVYGIGLGPGDPELVSIKAYNLIKKNRDIFFLGKKILLAKLVKLQENFTIKKRLSM